MVVEIIGFFKNDSFLKNHVISIRYFSLVYATERHRDLFKARSFSRCRGSIHCPGRTRSDGRLSRQAADVSGPARMILVTKVRLSELVGRASQNLRNPIIDRPEAV